jgi:hypothetical protein
MPHLARIVVSAYVYVFDATGAGLATCGSTAPTNVIDLPPAVVSGAVIDANNKQRELPVGNASQ